MPSHPDSKNAPIEKGETFCRTCRFYDYVGDREQDQYGACRRHAPSPRLEPDQKGDEPFYANWPEVRWNDWCGEWQYDPVLDEPDDKEPTR